MKKYIAILLTLALVLFASACGKEIQVVESGSEPPESSSEYPPDWMIPSDMIIYPSLNAVIPNADAKMLTADEIDLFGLTSETTAEDLVQIFGEPKEIVPNTLDSWGRVTYVYDNMRFTFIETLNDKPSNSPGLYVAEFTRDDLTYPRGIKLGDSLYNVIAKFPQERDYRSEAMYGVPMDKFTDGFAKLLDYDTFTQEHGNYTLLICCGWWPTVCVNFDDDMNVKSVYVYYHGNGLGYP